MLVLPSNNNSGGTMTSLMEKLSTAVSDFKFRLAHQGENVWALTETNSHFFLSKNEREVNSIAKAEVVEVRAFKKDLFTSDTVTVLFVDCHGHSLEVTEDSLGYQSLISNQLAPFTPNDPDWLNKVIAGPFRRNEMILWTKQQLKH